VDKIFVTALLSIAGIISAIAVFNTLYPAITQSSDTMVSMERRIDQRMKSQVEIIQATKTAAGTVQVWVKNVGDARIAPPESSDIFFGPQGNFTRIPYNVGSPKWDYSIENDTQWNPRATLRITIYDYVPLTAGTRYFVKITLLTGVSTEYYFSW
jgi:hypothetical protein